jgi:glyoxylate/hydroxypyruvate reductase A
LAADSPLWTLDNVILSPHTASLACDESERLVDLFCGNLARYLTGRRLRNEVAVEA